MQNRAAAAIAALHWYRFEQQVLGITPLIAHASVGSICFDGNSIEAAVHWLEPSQSPEREFDVLCHRVATGHAFAQNLADFTETRKRFRNLLDWLKLGREQRLEAVKRLPASLNHSDLDWHPTPLSDLNRRLPRSANQDANLINHQGSTQSQQSLLRRSRRIARRTNAKHDVLPSRR